MRQPMRRLPTLRFDGFSEARQIGERAPQRRKRDKCPQTLAPADQTFIDKNLDCASDRESADPEPLRELRLALYPVVNRLRGDVRPQPIRQLAVERAS